MKKKHRKIGPDAEPGRRVRVMTLLDAVPGHANVPETGPPIMIICMAHRGEIEQPISLSLADAKLLWVKTTEVCASHGDDFCRYLINEFLT